VHVGIPTGVSRVDVQVIVPRKGTRVPTWQRGVDPRAHVGKVVSIRVSSS
jgi:hypothetical protein